MGLSEFPSPELTRCALVAAPVAIIGSMSQNNRVAELNGASAEASE